jgi:hypothetical protein
MIFVKNGSSRKRQRRSLWCGPKRSTFLFCDLFKLRKLHKPRPEFTVEILRSVVDADGEKKSGIIIDGTRIWNIFEPILSIYDLEESSDVSRALSRN